MKLQQLKYVVKVAEVGNITEASRRLFVSQPSITAAIPRSGARDGRRHLRAHEQGRRGNVGG